MRTVELDRRPGSQSPRQLVQLLLALVGPALALVGPALALVGDGLALVGQPLALVGQPLTLVEGQPRLIVFFSVGHTPSMHPAQSKVLGAASLVPCPAGSVL